ncbi:MAG: DUF1385 domain-containing protein, partial [Chloroflexota bacterium]|nr:DUF1385 domain-containing protein [Chloroflexota bacterium]
RTPFLRGIVMLWEMLSLGVKAMGFSARVATGEEEEEISRGAMTLTVATSLAFAVLLFFVLPLAAAGLLDGWLHSSLAKNAFEGAVRLGVLLLYIYLIGRIPDIRRVFGFHGAEHKTINAYEAGAELTPESVARYSTRHPRCGTGFLLFVVLVSILVFALLGWPSLWLRIASRILLVPLIAAISYEVLRLGARYYHLRPVRLLLAPSLALQGLTTREPDHDMLKTAIAALQMVLPEHVPDAQAMPELV